MCFTKSYQSGIYIYIFYITLSSEYATKQNEIFCPLQCPIKRLKGGKLEENIFSGLGLGFFQ